MTQNMLASQGTRRFLSFLISVVSIVAVTIAGIISGVDLVALTGPLTVIAGVASAALGFGSYHDAKVRTALIETQASAPPTSSGGPAR